MTETLNLDTIETEARARINARNYRLRGMARTIMALVARIRELQGKAQ